MSADPTPPAASPLPDVPPKPPSPGMAPAAAGLSTRLRRKRPLLQRLLTGRHYDDAVVVYRHTNFFYWWPVWLLGYVFALVCYFGDQHVGVVPAKTEAAEQRKVELADGTMDVRDVFILAKDKKLRTHEVDGKAEIIQPTIYVAPHRSIGMIYMLVLLIVIVLTSISMRGLWSVLVLMTMVLLVIILYLSNAWAPIFRGVGLLSIYINMGGFVLLSTVLLVLWAMNFFILDRMTYMIFTPGQVRVRLEIGGGEMVYDATGMTIQKQRADMLRHWGLGFGSGDLLIFPLNAGHAIELPNVLRVGRVVREIEQMVKEKVVVTSG
jgi:hypothetical protein